MKIILVTGLTLLLLRLHAQDTSIVDTRKPDIENDSVYLAAGFPGGDNAWNAYLMLNISPSAAEDHKAPKGTYIVSASYVIDTSGNVTEIKLVSDPGYGTGEDVLRVLKNSPKWLPASVNDRLVPYQLEQSFTYLVSGQ